MAIESERAVHRRTLLAGGLALGGLAVLGLPSAGAARSPRRARPTIVMHRSPTCGCCLKWAERAREAGYTVTVKETADIMAVKRRLGVPEALASCHTSEAGGYAVEGHVPLGAIDKLLATRPEIRGIAVPGMPLGAPGMEVEGYAGDAFEVFAFDFAGKFAPFRA